MKASDTLAGDALTRVAHDLFRLSRRLGETDEGLRDRISSDRRLRSIRATGLRARRADPEPWRRVSGFAVCPCGRTVKARGTGAEVHQYEPHDCAVRRGRALGLRPVEKGDGDDWLDLRIEERRKAAELPGRRDYFEAM
jgi:hypothetical protein